jgi:hypothetical protein
MNSKEMQFTIRAFHPTMNRLFGEFRKKQFTANKRNRILKKEFPTGLNERLLLFHFCGELFSDEYS